LVAAQIGFDFQKFASGSVLVEPSSDYPISTRIRDFSERYEWMAEDKTLPIVLIDDLDFMTTAFYSPPSVASQLVYVVWPNEGVIGEFSARLKACCNSEPAVVGLADFLRSHHAFLVYGGPRSAYRLEYFVKAGATVETKRATRDHFLVLVTYPERTAQESPPMTGEPGNRPLAGTTIFRKSPHRLYAKAARLAGSTVASQSAVITTELGVTHAQ
jgi:hypothetical protein